ncbi:hypothetical protein [Alkalibacterium sp. MB6]|uniref:hypothetical protein n=1 Tax=Alkalibacterium sp. MB6 TaxID=2081965 RepID=UPI00137B092A|nr:hypothetical protein [Alkalibacterium sp. MB6]
MDKYKTKMTINKWFSYISLETLSESSRQAIGQFDRYSKKLTFKKVLKLFLYAINDETDSLRHLDQQLVNPEYCGQNEPSVRNLEPGSAGI